jgi:poly(3-hydroxybutyrate) depolymerase
LSDHLIPYDGRNDIPSVESVIDIWRGINGCGSTPVTIYDADGILGLEWESSTDAGDIQLYTIEDQRHEWPREESLHIQATDVIWDFLKSYRRQSASVSP